MSRLSIISEKISRRFRVQSNFKSIGHSDLRIPEYRHQYAIRTHTKGQFFRSFWPRAVASCTRVESRVNFQYPGNLGRYKASFVFLYSHSRTRVIINSDPLPLKSRSMPRARDFPSKAGIPLRHSPCSKAIPFPAYFRHTSASFSRKEKHVPRNRRAERCVTRL